MPCQHDSWIKCHEFIEPSFSPRIGKGTPAGFPGRLPGDAGQVAKSLETIEVRFLGTWILDRLAINVELWVDLATHFDRYFGRIVGKAAEVAARAS
jgi:hypothetical protein